MFDVSKNLLNISQGLKKDVFDSVKNSFKDVIQKSAKINLSLSEFEVLDGKIRLKTTGVKRGYISMFLVQIQNTMKENSNLSSFTLQL